jgi:ribokinase
VKRREQGDQAGDPPVSGVVVFGGLNMDLMLETPRPAGPGETREGTRFYTAPGGKGGNQAVAAARLLDGRIPVELVARAGGDRFGDELLGYLRSAGVGTSCVRRDPDAASGVAAIFIDASGENYVNPVYGANAECDAKQLADVREALGDAAVLLTQEEVPLEATLEAMKAARDQGVRVILDPSPTHPALPDGFLAAADIITPNHHEAEDLCGVQVTSDATARKAARRLRTAGPGAVVITMGERGAWIETDGLSACTPAPKVSAVASVGAGDAFNGGLAAGLAEGLELAEAVRWGVAAGALCVTKVGAQEAMPSRSEVEALLAKDW